MKKRKIALSFRTILSRILFFNILIVLLVTLTPQVVFYNYFSLTYNREVNNYNMQIVKQVQRSVDELVLEKVVKIPIVYFSEVRSNQDLTYPLNFDIGNDPIRILNVAWKLADIRNTLDFIDSLDVYYKNGELLFEGAAVGSLNNTDTVGKSSVSRWFSRMRNEDFKTSRIKIVDSDTGITKDKVLYISSVPFNVSKEDRQAVIAIGVKRSALNDIISNVKYDGSLIILDENGQPVTSEDREGLAEKAREGGVLSRILSSGDGGFLKRKSMINPMLFPVPNLHIMAGLTFRSHPSTTSTTSLISCGVFWRGSV